MRLAFWKSKTKAAFPFDTIIEGIRTHKGFEDFPARPQPEGVDKTFSYPSHPADESYGHGPAQITMGKVNLPQELITANRKSFTQAINTFMPPDTMGRWMERYFTSDFMQTGIFQLALHKIDLAHENELTFLPDELAGTLDGPDRIRNDRRIFSQKEFKRSYEIAKDMPVLVLTVLAYQSAFVEYLTQLNGAIQKAPHLTQAEKDRGNKIITTLLPAWEADNFLDNILPAIALHYDRNHGGKTGEKATRKDFTDAMQWADTAGIFKNTATHKETGDVKQFTCPARGILMRVSRGFDVQTHISTQTEGTGMYQIYDIIQKQLDKRQWVARAAAEEISTKVQDLVTQSATL